MNGARVVPIAEFSPDLQAPGTAARYLLGVDGSLSGAAGIPALIARGREPGPTVLAVAGIHGDEYEGMAAIRGVFADLDPSRLRGCLVGILVANPFAYEGRTRASPPAVDGLNLARVFPGEPNGSPTRALAHELLSLALRLLGEDDLLVDFHSGSADVAFAPLVGFRAGDGPAAAPSEEAARHFGLPRLWRIPDAPGPFNAETARRGIPTVGTETTGRAGCDPADVAAFATGLRHLLAFKGMLPGAPPPPRFGGPPRDTTDVVAPATGFLDGGRPLFAEVAPGDRLGTIVTVFGDPVAEVRAPVGGTLWAARATPAVRRGELLWMIAGDG